ncbi:MAG: trypsin-like peptidase domain-containing protein [bacterium]
MSENDHSPNRPADAANPWQHREEPARSAPVEPPAVFHHPQDAQPDGPAGSPPLAQPAQPHPAGPWFGPTATQPAYQPPAFDAPRYDHGQSGAAAGTLDGSAPNATATMPPVDPANVGSDPTRRPGRARASLVSVAVLAALVGGGAGAATVAITDDSSTSSSASSLSVTDKAAASSAVTNGTVAAAAVKITPSVVTIQVTGSSESGTGSGVILRSDGYILTNDHVVSVAASGGSITVQTSDGRTAKATIVGRDTTDDLAVIKTTGLTNLTPATFASSKNLQVGQTVVAVGAPLGLSDTVTSGIVSATARTVRSGDTDQAVFAAVQTDAAINPGNSGGALTDLNGNLVGINAAIATANSSGVTVPGQTQQSGSIGIGFAIPSDEARRVADELIKTGKASHALLGVQVRSTAQSQSGSSTSTQSGAVIGNVTAGGAAAKAGLKSGDVVTSVDGRSIHDGDDLIAAIRAHAVGDSVTIGYTRDGSTHSVKATLASD